MLGQRFQKLNFCNIRAVIFFQSYVIMPAGRLRETESKRICQIFGLKSGRGHLEIYLVAAYKNVLKQYLTEKQNGYFQSGCFQ